LNTCTVFFIAEKTTKFSCWLFLIWFEFFNVCFRFLCHLNFTRFHQFADNKFFWQNIQNPIGTLLNLSTATNKMFLRGLNKVQGRGRRRCCCNVSFKRFCIYIPFRGSTVSSEGFPERECHSWSTLNSLTFVSCLFAIWVLKSSLGVILSRLY
jgi:hypothetical protein